MCLWFHLSLVVAGGVRPSQLLHCCFNPAPPPANLWLPAHLPRSSPSSTTSARSSPWRDPCRPRWSRTTSTGTHSAAHQHGSTHLARPKSMLPSSPPTPWHSLAQMMPHINLPHINLPCLALPCLALPRLQVPYGGPAAAGGGCRHPVSCEGCETVP